MKKLFRKTITFAVALALIVTLLPMTAFAAPGDDDNTLKSIAVSVSGVNLNPTFSPGTLNYSLALPTSYTDPNVTLTATANNASAKVGLTSLVADAVTGSNQKTVSVTNNETKTVKFYVFSVDYPTTDLETYTITITRAKADDCNLKTLTGTPGTLSPTFAQATTSYTLTVPKESNSTVVKAEANSGLSTLKVGETATPTYGAYNATTGYSVSLPTPGDSKIVKFQVTAQDTTTKEYTVTVKRALYATLNVTVKDDIGSGYAFQGVEVGIYTDAACTASVGSGTTNSSGLYTLGQLEADDYWVKIKSVPSGYTLPTLTPTKVTVAEGETKNITITVPKQGNYSYYGNQLKSIGFSITGGTGTGSFTEVFDPNDRTITLVLGEGVTSARITPVLYDKSSTLYIAGRKVSYRDVSFKYMGSSAKYSIKVVPTKASGLKSVTYTLTVKRAASSNKNLARLTYTTTGVTVSPVFNKATTTYTLTLSNTVSSFKLYPTVEGYKASYKIRAILQDEETERSQSSTVSLKPGESRKIIVRVTAQDKSTRDYVINATRLISNNADLKKLTATYSGTTLALSPAFDKSKEDYTLALSTTQGSLTLAPEVADSTAKYIIEADDAASGKTITVNPGKTKEVEIIVTAQNGDTKTYTITVTRAISQDANLKSITVSQSALSPAFNKDVQMYALPLTSAQPSVKFTITKNDTTATFSSLVVNTTSTGGSSVPYTSGTVNVSLTPGQIKYVIITVRAQDGTIKDYIIRIVRAAS